ncbi:MAG: hypothetical protein IT452_23480, partial [Planctomycetia bacterium]|nr:hypothetical protein [Planctomycetia bacterium]
MAAPDKDQTIGRLAVSRGIISQSQLRQCIEEQQKSARPLPLAVILLKKGFLDDRDLETLMEASERIAGAKTTSQENTTSREEVGSKASAYSDALGSLIDSGEGKAVKPGPQRSRTVETPGGMGIAAMADALDAPAAPRKKPVESSGPSLVGDSLSAMEAMEAGGKRRGSAPPPDEVPAAGARRRPAEGEDGPASFDRKSVGTGLVNTSALPDLDDEPAPPPRRGRPAPVEEPAARRGGPPPADDEMIVPPKRRPTEPPKVAEKPKDDGKPADYDKVSVTSGLVNTSALPDLDDEPAPPPRRGRPAPVEEPAARRGGPPPADDDMIVPPKRRPTEPPKVAEKPKDDGKPA